MPSILPRETKANKIQSQSGFLAYHQGGHNQTKLYLRIASIVLSIILIGLSVGDSKRTYEWHVITDDNAEAVTQSWWSTVPVVSSHLIPTFNLAAHLLVKLYYIFPSFVIAFRERERERERERKDRRLTSCFLMVRHSSPQVSMASSYYSPRSGNGTQDYIPAGK